MQDLAKELAPLIYEALKKRQQKRHNGLNIFLGQIDSELIRLGVKEYGYDLTQIAKIMGISRTALAYKVDKLGLMRTETHQRKYGDKSKQLWLEYIRTQLDI